MKHLENFKSDYIQSIYDFLEQDADVSDFKRDLIVIAKYKKVDLHDLEAELFQYADLMNEDLSDKITFVFREDGYLGMFGDSFSKSITSQEDFDLLKTGDIVSALLDTQDGDDWDADNFELIYGTIWIDEIDQYTSDYDRWKTEHGLNKWGLLKNRNKYNVCFIQNALMGYQPRNDGWENYGKYSWSLGTDNYINKDHKGLRKYSYIIPNIISDSKEINDLKNNMHFALVIKT